MEVTTMQLVALFFVAGLIGVGSVVDESMIYRPIISCPLTGLILGDLTTGVILGGTLEMLALGWMNVGAAMAPDGALAGVVSTILVVVGHQDIGTGIALAVPLAAAGQVLTIFVRTITVFFQHLADKFAASGSTFGIEMCHIAGMGLQFIRVAVPAVAIAAVAGTDVVNGALNAIPEVITRGLQVSGGFIVVVGYAMVINMMNAKSLMPFFFLGFLIAVFTDFNLVAFGALGLILAFFHIKSIEREANASAAGGSAPTGNPLDDIDDSELM
ncbi:PTS mannose transporter subunit IIC [Selenomonas sp. TAMA-11512]|uniref:PTS mannose/fructose/sorbose transporter subunit IIC n=1 Tax=Selenomonas sp. TAMA-11512 TaxID=3095337 RepID=UPI00308BF3EA|nr:PTS mannose transporter subunit IIC [Selenomonas sp. TAMA-11512]